MYDYRAEGPEELPLRTGELVVVLDDRSNRDWWRGRDERGDEGWLPASFVETLVDDDASDDLAHSDANDQDEDREPATPEQRLERKRRMEVVRERRRRDREGSTSSALTPQDRRLPSLMDSPGSSPMSAGYGYGNANGRRLGYGGAPLESAAQMY